jgi:uncharacterized membrane protein YsdA (DUF1294 family)/cold shock CspA family protein
VTRHHGRITSWKDDKGFGFITPTRGGPDVFVHVSSFTRRDRRPTIDEFVTYAIGRDSKGRPRGIDVAPIGTSLPSTYHTRPVIVATLSATAFLFAVAGVGISGHLPITIVGLYFGVSLISFCIYGIDKSAAKRNRWRTAESTLHLLGLFGGWPGGLVAQHVFRHKTTKRSFQVAFGVTVVLNCGALGWILTPAGRQSLSSLLGDT